MAHERLSDASVVWQSDTALIAVVVGAAIAVIAVVLTDVGSSNVCAGVGTVVGCRQRSFGLVSPLADGPVGIAIKAQSIVYSLLLHFSGVVRGWNDLGATCK